MTTMSTILTGRHFTIAIFCNANGGHIGHRGLMWYRGRPSVRLRDDARFSWGANAGYVVASAEADGSPVESASGSGSYTFANVQAPHTLRVRFEAAP